MTQPAGPFCAIPDPYLWRAVGGCLSGTAPHFRSYAGHSEATYCGDSGNSLARRQRQVVSSHRNGYKAAGVLILIHRTLLKQAVLAHAEPYPGRFLHLRITHQSWALDCVVVYQRPLNWQRQTAGVPVDSEQRPPKCVIRSGIR